MGATADIVIIGAGVTGLSTALQLAQRGPWRVLVLDKGRGPGEGSTGASSAVCRCLYTHDFMIGLAREGIAAYRDWAAFTGLAEPLARFHELGVLWLTPNGAEAAARLRAQGAGADLLSPDEARRRFPAVRLLLEDESGPAPSELLLEPQGGYIEPMDVLADLLTAVRAAGVEVRFGAPVEGVAVEGGRASGVRLGGGEMVSAGAVLNAAGPWSKAFNACAPSLHAWPLEPVRIQMVEAAWPASLQGPLPVCVDPASGTYFRSQSGGARVLVGSVRGEDEREVLPRPEDAPPYVDDEFERRMLHGLERRLEGFRVQGRVHGYCGVYLVNRRDMHPLLGASELDGYYVGHGFSGHGFKLAPAAGSLLARAITGVGGAWQGEEDALKALSPQRTPIELESLSVLA